LAGFFVPLREGNEGGGGGDSNIAKLPNSAYRQLKQKTESHGGARGAATSIEQSLKKRASTTSSELTKKKKGGESRPGKTERSVWLGTVVPSSTRKDFWSLKIETKDQVATRGPQTVPARNSDATEENSAMREGFTGVPSPGLIKNEILGKKAIIQTSEPHGTGGALATNRIGEAAYEPEGN